MSQVMVHQLRMFKDKGAGKAYQLRFNFAGGQASLVPVHKGLVKDASFIHMIGEWRERHSDAYPTVFEITDEGTARWVQSQLVDRDDRILFMVATETEEFVGHLGLSNIDFDGGIAEIDSVIRGVDGVAPGIMSAALERLMEWVYGGLKFKKLFLRVFQDNVHAIKYYEKIGFKTMANIPLHKFEEDGSISYKEIPTGEDLSVDRTFTVMEHSGHV